MYSFSEKLSGLSSTILISNDVLSALSVELAMNIWIFFISLKGNMGDLKIKKDLLPNGMYNLGYYYYYGYT